MFNILVVMARFQRKGCGLEGGGGAQYDPVERVSLMLSVH